MDAPVSDHHERRWPILALVMVATGIGAGLVGMLLALFLHFIQHVAYGYSLGALGGAESFLDGVSAAPPIRRVAVMAVCGLVAGIGWWLVHKFGRPLVSVHQAIELKSPLMPVFTTLANAALQMATVGLGAPLGREGAPRQASAALAGLVARRAGLQAADKRMMIACAAGAGLAAIYNVPLGGALFTLEGLLGTFAVPAVIAALVTSVIATLVAWAGLGDELQYTVLHYKISPPLVVWAVVTGPLFGYAAYWFAWLTTAARARAPHGLRTIPSCLVTFTLIGCCAIAFPQILGNGKGPTQLGFENDLPLQLAAALLLLKIIAVAASLRAGAEGGLLTPGLSIGALLGTVLGGFWALAFPQVPLGAFAIVGAAAFLASSMKMPITAIVLAVEFTRVNHDFLIPIFFCVAGSIAMFAFCTRHYAERLGHAFSRPANDVAAPADLSPPRN